MVREFQGTSALDEALIAEAQKAEHYEITTYGSLCSWAKELGKTNAFSLLKENLSEEKEADQKLTGIGEKGRNRGASRQDTWKRSETESKSGKMVGAGR